MQARRASAAAACHVKVVEVPRADYFAVLDGSLSERTTMMRAFIVQRRDFPIQFRQAEGQLPRRKLADMALGRQLANAANSYQITFQGHAPILSVIRAGGIVSLHLG